MAHYQRIGHVPPKRHTQHRDARGRPLLRGADGGGGLLLRLLAALPPRAAVGDRRRPRRGSWPTCRPRRTTRCCRGTCTLHDLFPDADVGARRRRRDRPPARPRQRRRAHLLRRRRTRRARCYRNGIGDECVYVERGRGPGRDGVRRVRGRRGRLRGDPAGDDPPVAAPGVARTSRCGPTASRPTRTSAPPKRYLVQVRPAARARAVLRARPAGARRRRCSPRTWARPRTSRPRSTSSTGATGPRASSARCTPTPTTRSTSSAGTAASTRTRSTSPTSSRSPGGCTSRRRCTRCSRATTS